MFVQLWDFSPTAGMSISCGFECGERTEVVGVAQLLTLPKAPTRDLTVGALLRVSIVWVMRR